MSARTFYEILEVPFYADAETIRKAYLAKSLQYHPDKYRGHDAQARFVEVGAAYETLSDPQRRRRYDEDLRYGRLPSGSGVDMSPNSYRRYMDSFDAAVAGMSDTQFRIAAGSATVVAGIAGSMVGRRLLGGGCGFLSKAGAAVGGIAAREVTSSSVRRVHQDSVNRVSYKEDYQRAINRGQSLPEPPQTSQFGQRIGNAFKDTVGSVKNFATEATSKNKRTEVDTANYTSYAHAEESGAKTNKYKNMWKKAANGVKFRKSKNNW